jgi:hypothetical protein
MPLPKVKATEHHEDERREEHEWREEYELHWDI